MDFGGAARDYARHRAGFPASFFERVPLTGRVLDLGSGTGSLARGLQARGQRAVALDVSRAMLASAPDLLRRVRARAEAVSLKSASFDAVVAGQCWHWFDGHAAAREARRLLEPCGKLVIAHFDYLAMDGNVARDTERLILAHNPSWPMAGSDGRYERWRPYLEAAGFERIESLEWDEDVTYSHEAWRGRIRTCNGVLALGETGRIADFDAALQRRLAEQWPDPLVVPHRVYALSGRAPGRGPS